MLDPKKFLEQEETPCGVYWNDKGDGISITSYLGIYRTHIIQSIIQDLSIQRNVSPEVLEYLRGKV